MAVLAAAFLGLVFDGVELGLMPVASLSVTKSLLGDGSSPTSSADSGSPGSRPRSCSAPPSAAACWAISATASAAPGRWASASCSTRRSPGSGAFVTTCEQMLVLRFLVGLGVGGMWPNGVALVAECWPNTSRPTVAGILGAGINVGILGLSQLGALYREITPDSWRWIFALAAIPAVLGVIVLWRCCRSRPSGSPRAASRKEAGPAAARLVSRRPAAADARRHPARVGAAGRRLGRQQMDDPLGRRRRPAADMPGYKATTQQWWALGATIGSFLGARSPRAIGRRLSYFLISLGATALTWAMFQLTAPLEPSFLPIVFAQGLVATLFFGWLPLYLPELFPVHVRATGAGVSMNIGRFVTAGGVLAAGCLFA